MQHARAHVALHLLHGRFRRQAVADRLFQPTHPAPVIGEHPVGFQYLAVLTLERHLAARQHVVDRQPQRAERIVEPPDFRFRILVEQVGDHNARLVQNDMAEPDAIVERRAAERHRPAEIELHARPRQPRKVPGCDHFGNHHRRRFERFCLVFAIGAHRAVLHDQHAERTPCPQHRHAEERVVNLLARLRQIGEGRMLLRVRKVQRPCAGRDRADETLAEPQLRKVNRARVQTLGGVQLEHGIGAQDVERAHLGHHVLGDVADDLVEPLLWPKRFRHELPQPSQQYAWS